MSEQLQPLPQYQPGSAPGDHLKSVPQGSEEPFFDPNNLAHKRLFTSEVNQVLVGRNRPGLYSQRVVSLAVLTLNAHRTITCDDNPELIPEPDELLQFFIASESLKADSNADYLLSLVDSEVTHVVKTSPIAIAQSIKRTHALHAETDANLLLIKMWALHRIETPMPRDYQQHLWADAPMPKRRSYYRIINPSPFN